jgi:hypothetical protein
MFDDEPLIFHVMSEMKMKAAVHSLMKCPIHKRRIPVISGIRRYRGIGALPGLLSG